MIPFISNGHLTLGVEIEVQLLDPKTLDLKPAAKEIFARTQRPDKIKPEIFQSMAEVTSGICTSVQDAEADLRDTMDILKKAAGETGVLIATTGTHPFARYAERRLYPSERYEMLIDRNQWFSRRWMIFGLHVHLGMKDGDTCIRFNNFFLHMIPHLLALTASSPFWQGEDTGLASCRSTIFESCPTAGHPCRMHSWEEFSDLCKNLIHSKSIGSHKDLWWDIRPSPQFGTIEIRVCDGLATMSETLAVIAFIHALAHWYDQHSEYDTEMRAPYMWMMRENKWRAARHGLQADIINSKEADLYALNDDITLWMKQLQPQVASLGYERYFEALGDIVQRGASHTRQRAVFEKSLSLHEVVRHNTREFETGLPVYP